MKAYSQDLRKRVFSYSICHTIKETAARFRMSPNTVYLLKKLFYETGSLLAKKSDYKAPTLISPEGELYLQYLFAKQADITLEKLRDEYEKAYGIRVSMGTMYNTVKKMGFTRKKKSYSDPKKDQDKVRQQTEDYLEQRATLDAEKCFFS